MENGAPRRATSSRKHQENTSVAAHGRAGDDGAGKELEDEAAGPAVRDEGVGARVLRVDGLATRSLPLPQPPDASCPRRRPREVQEAGPAPGKTLPEERPGADAAAAALAQARVV